MELKVFSDAWLQQMQTRAQRCKLEQGCSPDITTGCYAGIKTPAGWKISNGRCWWDNPVLVQEIHQYADGTVCMHFYIEGVQLYNPRTIEKNGLKAIHPAQLQNILPVRKIVFFDHRETDTAKAARSVHIVDTPESFQH